MLNVVGIGERNVYDIRVVIIDPDVNNIKRLKEQLTAIGHIVVAEAKDERNGIRYISQTQPDIIMISSEVAMETIKIIEEHRIAPILIIAPKPEVFEHLKTVWVSGWVSLDMNNMLLESTIQLAINIYKKLCQLEQEVKDLKRTIEERKLIEQAKGLLMEKKSYTERKAFQYMRKLSMDKCVPMVKVAKAVIKSLRE